MLNLMRNVCAMTCVATCLLFNTTIILAEKEEAQTKPNIIFFFTDDQGWQDMGNTGHPYLKTPNLDRLAREGTRFDQFYSSASVCSPSRVAFMTGHFPAKHKIHQHFTRNAKYNAKRGMPNFLDPELTVITRVLQQNGYRTGHFGKWHLGNTKDAPELSAYGIDEHRALGGNGPGWDRHGNKVPKGTAIESYSTCTNKDYFWTNSTDFFVDAAIDFIKANKGQPFYMNLWTILPHAPNRPTPEQLKVYRDTKVKASDFSGWMPDYITAAKDPEQQMKNFCAVMTANDAALGRLLEALDELGIADNTLIFFTSDNGPEDYHIGNMRNSGMGATGELRGRKRSLYEGGVRMPCIARWPGKVPAGKVNARSVLGAVDWFPTVCEVAGIQMPDIKPDGENVTDILLGKERQRRKPLFWEWRPRVWGNKQYFPPSLAIRSGEWKLFSDETGTKIELYNIPKDDGERNNVADQYPEKVKTLKRQLLDWKKTLPN